MALDLAKDSGSNRPNVNLDCADVRRARRQQWFEVQFESLFQIGQRLFFSFALARHIHFQTLAHVPGAFATDGRGKGALHFSMFQVGDPDGLPVRNKLPQELATISGSVNVTSTSVSTSTGTPFSFVGRYFQVRTVWRADSASNG